MPGAVKGRRAYDSSLRKAQAERTRAALLDSSRQLFLERGYAATSVRDLAEAAGVSVQTVYDAFGSKARLASRLAEIAVVGDDEPLALAEREEAIAALAATRPADVVRAFAAIVRGVWQRFGPLLPVLRDGAAVEPELAEEYRRNVVENRRREQGGLIAHLASIGGLRDGLDHERAADELWALSAPEPYEALVLVRGWSPEEYERWLADVLAARLLPPTRRPRSAR